MRGPRRASSWQPHKHKLKDVPLIDPGWLYLLITVANPRPFISFSGGRIISAYTYHEVNTAKGNSRRHDCGGGAPPVGSL